jgi:hypothetical protein
MSKLFISMFLIKISVISSLYLTAESNYKPQHDRNNVINKGVWLKNNKDKLYDRTKSGDFIFRANSLDVDNILQNNFDAFGDMQESPVVSSYVERSKRSSRSSRK